MQVVVYNTDTSHLINMAARNKFLPLKDNRNEYTR